MGTTPMIPSYYVASTTSVAEKAIERGYLKYPGICFISSTNTLGWLDIDHNIHYIRGHNQITSIKYDGSNLIFYSDSEILFSYNVSISPDSTEAIIQDLITRIHLDDYAKSADVSRLLDDMIGDLADKTTVVDYINSLSYNDLSDVPIVDKVGTLSNIITVSTLNDGVYKIKGQFMIGGTQTTVHSSANDTFFIVSHSDAGVAITQLQANTIKVYFMNSDGTFHTDRYITEQWISEQDFISAATVKDYVKEIIADTVKQLIDETLDERLDIALDNKIGGLTSDDIKTIFQKKGEK